MKKFFRIESRYAFEWNDLRAGITFVNVLLIMAFGLSMSWFGLAVAGFGLIKDFTTDRRISSILMHFSNLILNIFFINMWLTSLA